MVVIREKEIPQAVKVAKQLENSDFQELAPIKPQRLASARKRGKGRKRDWMEELPQEALEGGSLNLVLAELESVPLLTREKEGEIFKIIEQGEKATEELEGFEKNGNQQKLTSEEIAELKKKIKQGEEKKTEVVEANHLLVLGIALKYKGHGVPVDDLFQEGNIGLLRAIKLFDYRRGNKFSTYAWFWIHQAVQRAVAEQGRTIRLPTHWQEWLWKVRKAQEKFTQEQGREPTVEELARIVGIPEKKINRLRKIAKRPISLETLVDGKGSTTQLGHFIKNEGAPDPSDLAIKDLLGEGLEETLRTLDPREQRVLELRYGLKDGRVCTLREAGKEFGLTRERIRQIEQDALRKLRHPSRSRKLRDFTRG